MQARAGQLVFIVAILLLAACRVDEEQVTAVPATPPVSVTSPLEVADQPTTAAQPTTAGQPIAVASPTPAPDQPVTVAATGLATTTDTPVAATATPAATSTALAPVTSIQLQPVAGGFFNPTYLTHAGDERLFVVEQAGTITIIENGQRLRGRFLDIQDRVNAGASEQGLLSVAFHPNYSAEGEPGFGEFFVNYTGPLAGDPETYTIIARYRVSDDPNRADPDSRAVIMNIEQPYANHNGGQLQFGPDGYLYIGMGDGGSGGDPHGHGQNAGTLLGALLRIDVTGQETYAIPPDNPFTNVSGVRDEIWAYGLRNPWRFSFDRATGDLYLADVGQNTWEEVNFQPAPNAGGHNYGWNIMEGTHCFNSDSCDTEGLVLPVAEYGRAGGCSVTGGYVYRGRQFPSLTGTYFFADYCTGTIWGLARQADGRWETTAVYNSGVQISSFGEDRDGELYVINHNGAVLQIRPQNP